MGKRFSGACRETAGAAAAVHCKRGVRRKCQSGQYGSDGKVRTVLRMYEAVVPAEKTESCLVSEPAVCHGGCIGNRMEFFIGILLFHISDNFCKIRADNVVIDFGSCIKGDICILLLGIPVREENDSDGLRIRENFLRRQPLFYLRRRERDGNRFFQFF